MNPQIRILSELDRVIHEPGRLMIVALLSAVEKADFLYLLHETGMNKGTLSSHVARLEEAGYVEVTPRAERIAHLGPAYASVFRACYPQRPAPDVEPEPALRGAEKREPVEEVHVVVGVPVRHEVLRGLDSVHRRAYDQKRPVEAPAVEGHYRLYASIIPCNMASIRYSFGAHSAGRSSR